jgi:hypothetical protein
MDEEDYRNLVEWHRGTQRMLTGIQFMVGIMFFITVVSPIMKALGLWNWLGWPDPFFS